MLAKLLHTSHRRKKEGPEKLKQGRFGTDNLSVPAPNISTKLPLSPIGARVLLASACNRGTYQVERPFAVLSRELTASYINRWQDPRNYRLAQDRTDP